MAQNNLIARFRMRLKRRGYTSLCISRVTSREALELDPFAIVMYDVPMYHITGFGLLGESCDLCLSENDIIDWIYRDDHRNKTKGDAIIV